MIAQQASAILIGMRRPHLWGLPLCWIFAACAGGPLSGKHSAFHTRTVAITETSGAGKQGTAISAAFSRHLEQAGIRSFLLEETDEVLAGSAMSLPKDPNPRLLQEIRRVTSAEAVAILALDGARRWVDVTVLDARDGAVLLSAKEHPAGEKFKSINEVAGAAAKALSLVPGERGTAPEARPRSNGGAGQTTLGIGVNVVGGQLDYQPTQETRLELRYQLGKSGAGAEKVAANVFGVRAYRLFRAQTEMRPYLGLDASYVAAKESIGSRKASGGAGGAFIGIERRIFSRLWLGVDAGPYFVYLSEKTSSTHQSNLEFVANTSLIFYLF